MAGVENLRLALRLRPSAQPFHRMICRQPSYVPLHWKNTEASVFKRFRKTFELSRLP